MNHADRSDPRGRRHLTVDELFAAYPADIVESRPDARQIADAWWLWDQISAAGGSQQELGMSQSGGGGQQTVQPVGGPTEPSGHTRESSQGFGDVSEAGAPRSDWSLALERKGYWRELGADADARRKAHRHGEVEVSPRQVRYLDENFEPESHPVIMDQAAMARALRPLQQMVASTHRQIVDEVATAEGLLDLAAPFPVFRPATERWWELVLVVDTSTSMSVAWADAVPGLIAFFECQGIFRDVIVRYIDTDISTDVCAGGVNHEGGVGYGVTEQSEKGVKLRIRRSPTDPAPVGAVDLIDHSARRIIWVLTDGVGRAWQSHALTSALGMWARRGPVAVVNLLPSLLWRRTTLRVERLRMRSAGRFGTGTVQSWMVLDPLMKIGSGQEPDTVPVPVLELESEWIGRWASFIAAPDPVWADMVGVLVRPDSAIQQSEDLTDTIHVRRSSAVGQVRAFMAGSSPTAQKLASALAAAPITTGSLRLVADMAAVGRPQISELFSYGLLRSAVGPSVERLDFAPEVRDYLVGLSTRSEVDIIRRAVGSYLARLNYRDLPEDTRNPVWIRSTARDRASAGSGHTAESMSTGDQFQTETTSREPPDLDGGVPILDSRVTGSVGDVILSDRGAGGMSASPTPSSPGSREGRPVEAVTENGDSVGPVVAAPGPSATNRTPSGSQPPAAPLVHTAGRLPAVWGNIPPRNPHFTGRQEMLDRLEERLRGGRTTTVVPEAVHGMGGVGKTQLAIEFVYRHLADYDIIWWIPAERTVQIGNALSDLGARLGLATGTEANVVIREVLEALRVGRPYSRWLLVFDNAEDPKAVREFFPQGAEGQILVTSRNSGWANYAHSLEVTVFQRVESIQLLRSRGGPLSENDANLVAEALGDLPLAVEQAATWRAETGMSAQEYVRLLDDKKSELLDTAPVDYELPVTAAWNVSLDRLQESNPAALEMLQACAFFAPEPISRSLLARGYNETISPALDEALRDPVKLGQAIRAVNRYALARIDHRSNSIVMHRLVQAVLIGRMTAEEQVVMRSGAHTLLAASDPNDPQRPAVWGSYADLYPHVIASHAADSAEPRVRRLLVNLVEYLNRWGDHAASATLAESTYHTWVDRFGADDPSTLDLALQLGWILGILGRYTRAADMNRNMLDGFVRVYGADSEQTLQAYGNVISDLRFSGGFEASFELAKRANESAIRALGPEDPVTLSTTHNVSVTLRLLGRFAEAQQLDEETWRLRSLLFGEDDVRTLNTLSGLIIDRRELGDYIGACVAAEDAYVRYQQLFPEPNNPFRLRAALNLAVARRKAGRHKQALELSRDVELRLFNRYGGDHPESMAAGLGLSIDLRYASALGEAHKTCMRARDRYTGAFGERHPHTLSASASLAVVLRLMGNTDEAALLDEASVAVLTEQLGSTHPSTLACATNLASDFYAQGRFQEAHDRDVEIRQQLSATLGEVHPSTLAVSANLAMDLRALDFSEEALRLQADTLRLLDAVLGLDHQFARQAAAWVRSDCDVDTMPL